MTTMNTHPPKNEGFCVNTRDRAEQNEVDLIEPLNIPEVGNDGSPPLASPPRILAHEIERNMSDDKSNQEHEEELIEPWKIAEAGNDGSPPLPASPVIPGQEIPKKLKDTMISSPPSSPFSSKANPEDCNQTEKNVRDDVSSHLNHHQEDSSINSQTLGCFQLRVLVNADVNKEPLAAQGAKEDAEPVQTDNAALPARIPSDSPPIPSGDAVQRDAGGCCQAKKEKPMLKHTNCSVKKARRQRGQSLTGLPCQASSSYVAPMNQKEYHSDGPLNNTCVRFQVKAPASHPEGGPKEDRIEGEDVSSSQAKGQQPLHFPIREETPHPVQPGNQQLVSSPSVNSAKCFGIHLKRPHNAGGRENKKRSGGGRRKWLKRGNKDNNTSQNGGRRRNEDRLAIIFMAIIFIFIICHFPRVLLDVHELATISNKQKCKAQGQSTFPFWSHLCLSISQFLLVVNSAVNMVVYCLLGSKFRSEVMKTARHFSAKAGLAINLVRGLKPGQGTPVTRDTSP